jgi:hypothetical protein
METAEPERPKQTGRPLGKGNLSEDQKLGIVTQKKLQLMSQSKIAQEFDVARFTVNRITEDDLKPETRLKLDSFVDKLGQAREKVIQRINEKLDNNDFKDGVYPNLLNAVNSNYRLETNQSTANIAVLDVASLINKTLEIAVKLHRADHTEPLPTRAEIADNYAQLCAKNGVQPDESLIDFSVLDSIEPPQS